MKTSLIRVGTLMALLAISQSCQKEDVAIQSNTVTSFVDSPKAEVTNRLQTEFALILAKALKEDSDLRVFLKSEALKQFDKDYDVLFQLVKNKPIAGGASLKSRLAKYATSPEQITIIEEQLPLLTILVPTLPSGFSAETWDTQTQIPVVAVSKQDDNKVPVYDDMGKENVVKPGQIPGFPVVVIKQNERVLVSRRAATIVAKSPLTVGHSENYSFYFLDASCNGISSNQPASRPVTSGYPTSGREVDPILLTAYRSEYESPRQGFEAWQRDWVYYKIGYEWPNPAFLKGSLNRDYKEYIRSIKLSADALSKISDQSPDPSLVGTKAFGSPVWTEGYFEFRVQVLNNAKDGTGVQYTRIFTAKGSDLYDITYRPIGLRYYVVDTITPKHFLTETDLVTWDLSNFGVAWKFFFYEVDPSEIRKETRTHSTVFAANFEVSASGGTGPIKLSGKFGGSAQVTNTQTHEVTINLGDDFLGESLLNFSDPVLLDWESTGTNPTTGYMYLTYPTYEINTGGATAFLSASVEPKKWR
jgi:hypothetical protein